MTAAERTEAIKAITQFMLVCSLTNEQIEVCKKTIMDLMAGLGR